MNAITGSSDRLAMKLLWIGDLVAQQSKETVRQQFRPLFQSCRNSAVMILAST